ncbi:hypothetical protein D3C85_1336200 [compost metagenome]
MPYKAPSDLAYEEGVTHNYTYEIRARLSSAAEDFAEYDRIAEALNMSFVTAICPSGAMPIVQGPLSDNPDIGISSFHYCSELKAWILRLYDASGYGAAGVIHLPVLVSDRFTVQEQNAIQQSKAEPIPYSCVHGLEVSLEPFQIRTFAIKHFS